MPLRSRKCPPRAGAQDLAREGRTDPARAGAGPVPIVVLDALRAGDSSRKSDARAPATLVAATDALTPRPHTDLRFEREARVIKIDRHFHANSAFAFLTTFSTENPSSLKTTSPGADAP